MRGTVVALGRDIVDDIDGPACRQQRARDGTCDVEIIADDRRRRAGHAVDPRVAFIGDAATRRLDHELAEDAGIQHTDPDARFLVRGLELVEPARAWEPGRRVLGGRLLSDHAPVEAVVA